RGAAVQAVAVRELDDGVVAVIVPGWADDADGLRRCEPRSHVANELPIRALRDVDGHVAGRGQQRGERAERALDGPEIRRAARGAVGAEAAGGERRRDAGGKIPGCHGARARQAVEGRAVQRAADGAARYPHVVARTVGELAEVRREVDDVAAHAYELR